LKQQKDLQHVVQFKYQIRGKARPMPFIKSAYPTFKLMNSLALEHVGKYDAAEDKTSITVQFVSDKTTFDALAKFSQPGSPLTLEQILSHEDPSIKALAKKVKTWLGIKQAPALEKIITSSIHKVEENPDFEAPPLTTSVNGVLLQSYASDSVVKRIDKITWCLVGDAAFGVPFFRSMNNGLLTGSVLAKDIGHSLEPQETSCYSRIMSPDRFRTYRNYSSRVSSWEMMVARIKSLFIDMARGWISFARWSPLQIYRLAEGPIGVSRTTAVV
jgi:hypothetical protein